MTLLYLTPPLSVNECGREPAHSLDSCIPAQPPIVYLARLEHPAVAMQARLPLNDNDVSSDEALRVVLRLADVFQQAGLQRTATALIVAAFSLADQVEARS